MIASRVPGLNSPKACWEVLQVAHLQLQRNLEQRLDKLSLLGTGAAQKQQEQAPAVLVLEECQTKSGLRDLGKGHEGVGSNFFWSGFSLLVFLFSLLPFPDCIQVPFSRRHPATTEVQVSFSLILCQLVLYVLCCLPYLSFVHRCDKSFL